MINTERAMPIQMIDRLSDVGEKLAIAGVSYTVLKSEDVTGDYGVTATGDAGNLLADQPVVSLDFKTGTTAAVVYFIPASGYKGFSVAGTAVTSAGADVEAGSANLYKATLSSGTVTIAKVTP